MGLPTYREKPRTELTFPSIVGGGGLLNVQREKKREGQQKKVGDRFLPLKPLAPSHLPGSQNSKPPPTTELNSRGTSHSFQTHVYPVSSE